MQIKNSGFSIKLSNDETNMLEEIFEALPDEVLTPEQVSFSNKLHSLLENR